MPLKNSARFMQDGRKTVWSIAYVSVASFFPSLKQNFVAYHSSKVSSHPDCIFEIHQLWQSGFSRVYSNCCCSCSFKPEIIKISQSSLEMYRNNIVNFQESMTILDACTKKVWKHIECPTYDSKLQLLVKFQFWISGECVLLYYRFKLTCCGSTFEDTIYRSNISVKKLFIFNKNIWCHKSVNYLY